MDKGTIIRTLVLAVALINQMLVAFDLNPIPGNQDIWYEIASTVFTAVTAAVAWFRNNYITAKGRKQKEVLKKNGLTR